MLLLLIRAEPGDDRAADCGRDDHHQQATTRRREFLQDDRQLVHASPAAAELLRQVHAQEAKLACVLPELRQLPPGARLLGEVGVAIPAAQLSHRRAQRALLVGLGEVHWVSSSGLTTASTLPTSTCWPGATGRSVTMPEAGAAMTCSIFIASSQSSGWPVVTVSPTVTPTLATEPGMGASSEPATTWLAGSVNRLNGFSATGPKAESTHTSPGYAATSNRCRTPATSSSTRSAAIDSSVMSSRPPTTSPPLSIR